MALKFLVGLYGYLNLSFYESGALQDVLHLHDVLARVALAKLCHTVSRARALDGTLITTEDLFDIVLIAIYEEVLMMLLLLQVQNVRMSDLSSIPYCINSFWIPVKEFVSRLYFVYWVNLITPRGMDETCTIFFSTYCCF